MESEKVKEIKKGLEFMIKLDLSNKLPYIDGYTPKQIAYEEIFNYINELESENERYKQSCGAIGQNSLTIINQLKDRIAELEKGNEALSFAVKQGFNDCQHKTLQEFAKWLAKRSNNEIYIDLVKEYINE